MAFLSPAELFRGRVDMMRPEAASLLTRVMADFESQTGLKTTLPPYGGYRTPAVQAQLKQWQVQAGRRYAVGGVETSRHVYGAAFDLHILILSQGKWVVSKDTPLYSSLGAIGERHGLVWGGRWSGTDNDPFHFQLNESLDESRRRWEALVRGRLQRTLSGVVTVATIAFLLRSKLMG